MPKPTKTELAKYRKLLVQQLGLLSGDVGSMREEALRASDQDASVDHLADQGSDNYDQGFLLGLIENEEETMQMIEEAISRIDGKGEHEFGLCPVCAEQNEEPPGKKPAKTAKKVTKKADPYISKDRLEYLPWARYCVRHQEEHERSREIA